MAASKVGLAFAKSGSFKKAGNVNWCQPICGFPHPRTYGQEYNAWQNAMQSKMEQGRIPGWKQSIAAQWAAIPAYAITLQPVSRRSGLWQANNLYGERFTECLDLLLKNIAKKHQRILTDMLKGQPVAAIVVADPAPTRNDRKLAPSSVHYRAGRGGFSLARPRPYMGPGGYVSRNPRPTPVRGPPALIP